MQLKELLKYRDVVIQCHDNPDADALASGLAIYRFMEANGNTPEFIYRGPNEISKSNLIIMLKELEIPITYAPDYDRVPQLLVTVDCQYGQRNVTTTEAKHVAVIDHHQVTEKLPQIAESMCDELLKEGGLT